MPDLANVLKKEMRRLARSEATAQVKSLQQAVTHLRKTIWSLTRQNRTLSKQLELLSKATRHLERPTRGGAGKPRVTRRTIKAHRKRLGLSVEKFAMVLGVNQNSVYNWETGKMKPRSDMIEKILAARKLGKREVKEILGKGRAGKKSR